MRPILIFLVLLTASCGPLPDSRMKDTDLLPPQVQSVQALGPGEISISFDEDAVLSADKTRITPPLAVSDVTGSSKNVLLRGEPQAPGRLYSLEAEARDAHGNSTSFVAQFYGFNARVPRLLINEFTPRGSGNHPDLVELKALSAGNMGGVVFYMGSPESHDAHMVFPPFEVEAGSFCVIHLKPEKLMKQGTPRHRKASTQWTPPSISGSGTAGGSGEITECCPSAIGSGAPAWTRSCTATAPTSRMNNTGALDRKRCVPVRMSW